MIGMMKGNHQKNKDIYTKGVGYVLQKIQYFIHHTKVRVFGSKVYEDEWSSRHLIKGKGDDDWGDSESSWIEGYWDSVSHPHRDWLIQEITSFNPDSAFEVGCNCGPNLRRPSKIYPGGTFCGIDINPRVVELGTKWLKDEGLHNVVLKSGKADELSEYPDNHFDVVFSDAVLIYLGPEKIENVLKEMLRIAKKGVILVELNNFDAHSRDLSKYLFRNGLWVHNYMSYLNKYVEEHRICIKRLSREIWADDNWGESGAVVIVDKT